MERKLTWLNAVFLALAAGIMLMPAWNYFFSRIPDTPNNENRKKSGMPAFSFSNLDGFVKEYDRYYSDNFSLRDDFIALHNRFEYFVFGVSPVPDEVVIGKNGWFYDKDNIPGFRGSNRFTRKELKKIKAELHARTAWADSNGTRYYVAVVPGKMSVYPEYLPSSLCKPGKTTRYKQVVALNTGSTIRVIDLKKELLSRKHEGYDLYQRTDGHWNDLGAFYACTSILKYLKKDFPQLDPFPLDRYETVLDTQPGGQLVRMIHLEKEYPEPYVKLIPRLPTLVKDGEKRDYPVPPGISAADHQVVKVNDGGKKLKVLIIRDSFGVQMMPFFSEYFMESVFIHDEWKYRMREDLIEKEKPDIIINLIYENGLDKLLEFPFKAGPG
jgi:alginate O-acetyltransferase complex protein AlgJ